MKYDILENYIAKFSTPALEEKMSDEDAHDSELLRSIMQKTSERTNAKLTKEEQEVLAKYDLFRRDRGVHISKMPYEASDSDISNIEGGNEPERRHKKNPWYRRTRNKHDITQVNYADIARKRRARSQARIDAIIGDRIHQYGVARNDLKSAQRSRDYHQRQIDTGDDDYMKAMQKAKAEYDRAVQAANRNRDSVDTYHTPNRDRALKDIDSIFDRFNKK